ncbi:MAG: indolepyruvate ferredoxin oxidoreductase subunit alpha [Candidatus Heimdallarchaeota archaeon]|nr:indolepyruvate ferredoxin oxidoreductase subunit alpha [Candidatus Heimdallarchaeota archaeon]
MSSKFDFLLKDAPAKEILLGNDAFVRGMIEAGVKISAAYPGSPTSEIGVRLAEIANESGIYFEFSTNEKVATELAASAAIAGAPAAVFMKSVGLNVAADSFVQLSMFTMPGGLVVILGDDPGPHSSQNEQDNRYYTRIAHIPMLEPANVQEAKDFVVFAMEYAQKWKMPVVIRSTTRICHQTGIVEYGTKRKSTITREYVPLREGGYVPLPGTLKPLKSKALRNLEKWRELANSGALLKEEKVGDKKPQIGIITAGHAYAATKSALRILGVSANILKLGIIYPLPMKRIIDFIKKNKTVKILEELDPFIEEQIKVALFEQGVIDVNVIGKRTEVDWEDLMISEYDTNRLVRLFANLLGVPNPLEFITPEIKVPKRSPVLCPGCGHRTAFHAAKIVLDKLKGHSTADIGCYSLGYLPPHKQGTLLFSMGSGVPSAAGLKLALPNTAIMSFVGDSTFFHAAMPGIVNAVFNKHKTVLMVMDNGVTAMTGHQPNPNSGHELKGLRLPPKYKDSEKISIDETLKSWGVKYIKRVPAYDVDALVKALEGAFAQEEFAVVIQEEECALIRSRAELRAGKLANPYYIDIDICRNIQSCLADFACPAIEKKGEKPEINTDLCIGCGCCVQTCPLKVKPIKQLEEFMRV